MKNMSAIENSMTSDDDVASSVGPDNEDWSDGFDAASEGLETERLSGGFRN